MRIYVKVNMRLKLAFLSLLALLPLQQGKAQSLFAGLEPLFTESKNYTVYFAEEAPVIDGSLDDAAWKAVAWSEKFVDIEGDAKPKPTYDTRVKMVWDDKHLYIAAELKEPHVWATLKQHDQIIYHDNDFEVFLAPENTTHHYYEVEVNALNTILDLFLPKPYRNGGRAMIPWNLEKLQSAVQVQGTLNNPSDIDQGWTVEMAIPFRAVSMGNETKVPDEESLWRVNFSRVQWDMETKNGRYTKKKDSKGRPLPEHNWVWSPQGGINMHYPERWGYVRFSRQKPGSSAAPLRLPYAEKQKQYLWLVYYLQKEQQQKQKQYAASLDALGIQDNDRVLIEGQANQLHLEATSRQFIATIRDESGTAWSINQDGLMQKASNTL